MTVLFLHGSFSAPEDVWWPWLKTELEKLGNKVLAPQFPVDKWRDVGDLAPDQYEPSADLNSRIIKIHGLGHMGLEAKLTQFPEVLAAISTSGEVPEK